MSSQYWRHVTQIAISLKIIEILSWIHFWKVNLWRYQNKIRFFRICILEYPLKIWWIKYYFNGKSQQYLMILKYSIFWIFSFHFITLLVFSGTVLNHQKAFYFLIWVPPFKSKIFTEKLKPKKFFIVDIFHTFRKGKKTFVKPN